MGLMYVIVYYSLAWWMRIVGEVDTTSKRL